LHLDSFAKLQAIVAFSPRIMALTLTKLGLFQGSSQRTRSDTLELPCVFLEMNLLKLGIGNMFPIL
jgi:hypothetical protein